MFDCILNMLQGIINMVFVERTINSMIKVVKTHLFMKLVTLDMWPKFIVCTFICHQKTSEAISQKISRTFQILTLNLLQMGSVTYEMFKVSWNIQQKIDFVKAH